MKLTKAAQKAQEHIRTILEKGRLTCDDVDYVYANYQPPDVRRRAAYFTPGSVANEFYVYCDCSNSDRVLDLGAGIGALAHAMSRRRPREIVALKSCPEFVDIGRKLHPDVRWVLGDMFDEAVTSELGNFDLVVANPPYGLTISGCRWLNYRGASELMAVEIAMRLSQWAFFVMPAGSLPFTFKHGSYGELSGDKLPRKVKSFQEANPHVVMEGTACDMRLFARDWADGLAAVELVNLRHRNEYD